MTEKEILSKIQKQNEYFYTHQTKSYEFRIEQLKKLKTAIFKYENEIYDALYKDLRKSKEEAFLTEIFMVLSEIDFMLKKLKGMMKPKVVKTPFTQFPAKSIIYPEPYGQVLIISPWNYPFQLLFSPLVGSIASGNCSILKPSELSPYTTEISKKLIEETFEEKYIAVVDGAVEESRILLEQKFDYIFFTGSTTVGKIVMQAAAKNLTPITLELGGKSPCIVDKDVDIQKAAKRVAWGKYLNAGQTCVAPDYLYIHKDIKDEFIKNIKETLKEFYEGDIKNSKNFPRIISERHFDRLASFLNEGKIVEGGEIKREDKYIAPTIIDNITFENKIMQEEIFGPLLPVITFEKIEEVIRRVNSRPKPLALYIFTNNKNIQDKIVSETSAGGVCINDTLSHMTTDALPFGGVGESGMGSYHGKKSFDTFSHYKPIMKKSFGFELPVRFPPYEKNSVKTINILKKLLGR